MVASMFFWSLFHLLFIFAVARSRSRAPLGACQVSGNQSEWLILPAQKHTHIHTHVHTLHLQLFIVVWPLVFHPFTLHAFPPVRAVSQSVAP